MGWASSILLGALVVLAGAYVLHLYRHREVGVPGVGPLAALRIAALAVVLLLLLDPLLPAAPAALGAGSRWTLVDGSPSMAAPVGPGSPWSRASGEAGTGVLVFGDDDPLPLEGVDAGGPPPFASSRLVPALERAAESGAREVRVVSDLRIEDAARAREAAERLGLTVTVEPLGANVRSAGVAHLELEGPLESDEPVPARAAIFAVGTSAADSVTLEIREEGRLVAQRRLPSPDESRRQGVDLDLPPPQAEGEVRYTARVLLDGDAFPDDDERVAWVDVNPEEGNLVLVSLEPDWELRFLLPVVQRVTGLPGRGFLRVGTDRYLAMDEAGAGGTVDRAALEAVAAGAEFLVVQASATPPPWLGEALAGVPRAVVLARGTGAAAAAGIAVGSPRPGEWYASEEIPPSPLAGELAGAELAGLPPLAGVLPLAAEEPPGPVPLEVRLGGGQATEAAMVLVPAVGSAEGAPTGRIGRRVVVLASGFWRWGFRDGPGRDAYERLWSGVAGWLLADEPLARGPGVRPEERVVPRGGPVWWSAPGLAGTEVRVRLARAAAPGAGETGPGAGGGEPGTPDSVPGDPPTPDAVPGDEPHVDTVVTVPPSGRFRLPAPEPGPWSWQATAPAGGSDAETWEGRLDVERWTADLGHPRDTLLGRAGGGGGAGAQRPGRPLRTHPLPYLLVLTLLSAEWILRRRKGLR